MRVAVAEPFVEDTAARVHFPRSTPEVAKHSSYHGITKGHAEIEELINQSFQWNVGQSDLKNVPNLWNLDPTAIFIPYITGQKVAERVSDCLRRASIYAEYINEPVKARCKTLNLVDFRIRLFKGRGDYDHGVIVEVQKRDGCSISFSRIRKYVLNELQGKGPGASPSEINRMWECHKMLPLLDDIVPLSDHEVRKAVKDAISLIVEHRLDANTLGIESLCFMTESKRCCTNVDSIASTMILSSEEGQVVRDFVEAVIKENKLPYDKYGDYTDDSRIQTLRFLCFSLLYHTLQSLASKDVTFDCGVGCAWLQNFVMPVMVDELKYASSRPHEAFLAASSMNSLMKLVSWCQERANELEAEEALKSAHGVGCSCHAYLADATKTALQTYS